MIVITLKKFIVKFEQVLSKIKINELNPLEKNEIG